MKEDNDNESGKKQRFDSTLKKTASRIAAVQLLYQIAQNPPEEGIEGVLADLAKQPHKISSGKAAHQGSSEVLPNLKMLRSIVEGVLMNHGDLEDIISPYLTASSSAERLGPLLAAILRAGVYEMTMAKSAPYKVIINEYTNIAGAFLSDAEAALITAVLDKAAKQSISSSE